MKKATIITGIALAALMSGCAAVNPLEVKQTARDLQKAQDVITRPLPESRYKIAILSKSIKHASDPSNDNYLASEMESALATKLTGLGWFDTVDRKNGIAIVSEAMLSGNEDEIPEAQLALVAESSVTYIAKQGWKRTAYANKARGAEVITDFRLVDLSTKEPILVKKYRSAIDDTAKGAAREAITIAAAMNATKFAQTLASRLLPEGKVIQTRGDGKYAQISLGKNYQLTPEVTRWAWWPYKFLPLWYVKETVTPATTVDFVKIEKEGDAYNILPPFAKGSVISTELKSAWIEVENSELANVFREDKVMVAEPTADVGSDL